MEIKNMLLNTGEKEILIIRAKRLAELCSSILQKVNPVSEALGYQAEEISETETVEAQY